MTDPFLMTYLNRPELSPHLLSVWETFHHLSRRRPVGFAVGSIPMSEFESYCRTFRIDDPEWRQWLFVRIDVLDAEYLSYLREQRASKEAK